MCDDKNLCQFPEKLKGKVGECSPEQIKECHGTETRCSCGPDPKQSTEQVKRHADGTICTCEEEPGKK